MKKIAFLVAMVMIFSTILAACSSVKSTAELVVCVGPEPDTIDPALNSAVDGATLLVHAFEGLMNLDKDGVPVKGQAESYTISEDGLTYTFKLRNGLKWSDGEPLTAKDFVYAWNRAINPDTAADYEYMFESIEGYDKGELNVIAPDDKTLIVKLISVTPYFLELCAFPTFFPVRKDIVEASPDKWALDPKTYIGNGPYILTEWVHDSHMIFKKNKEYWNISKIGPESIKFLLMSDDNAVLAAFKNEEILLASSIPNDEIDAWRDKKEFNIEGQLGTYYISFNVKKPPLDNPKVRKALILAIDREYITTNIGKAGQQPAGAFVSTGLSDADIKKEFREVGGDYYDPSSKGYEANLEEAKKMLAEAGYPNGEGLPTIEYIYNVESTGHQLIGEAIQDMWKKIGVKIELASQEWNTFLNTRKNGEYFIARNGWLGDYNDPISFLDLWVTDGGNNDAQWSNSEYDALITKIKSSSDRKERMELMHRAENIIFEESMLCPIYYYVDIYLKSEKLQGFYTSPLGYKYFMYSNVK
jgi:oligopeptide transport system substrate-binding protein